MGVGLAFLKHQKIRVMHTRMFLNALLVSVFFRHRQRKVWVIILHEIPVLPVMRISALMQKPRHIETVFDVITKWRKFREFE